jgi:hypothetical protein
MRRVITDEHDGDVRQVERLCFTVRERLDDEDLYGDLLRRPIGEMVAVICRDLGLEPDWDQLAQEAWAQAEIAEAPEGSPFSSALGPAARAPWAVRPSRPPLAAPQDEAGRWVRRASG